MKEHPVLFQTPLVRAILAGAKTQTRRPLKPQPERPPTNRYEDLGTGEVVWGYSTGTTPPQGEMTYRRGDGSEYTEPFAVGLCKTFRLPWKVGDVLWCRETWAYFGGDEYLYQQEPGSVSYRADAIGTEVCFPPGGRWRPSIHMPRWACRLRLEVTDVQLERYDAISEADAISDGVEQLEPGQWRCYDRSIRNKQARCMSARGSFLTLWESLYGKTQPWAWAYSFRRLEVSP